MNLSTQLILAAAAVAISCTQAAHTEREQLTTEHEDALVRTVRDNGTLQSTILDSQGNAVLGLARSAEGDSMVLELPGGDLYRIDGVDPSAELGAWNAAVYSAYALQVWTRTNTDDEAYCHEDARGIGCRGACGAQCKRTVQDWVCLKASAQCNGSGDNLIWFERYKGYTRPCCISHDACYDTCKLDYRGGLCRRKCDAAAVKAGCGPKDALGLTGDKKDATKKNWYDPTGIPCEEEGSVTTEEPSVATGVDAGAPDNVADGDNPAWVDDPEDHAVGNCEGESCELTPTDHDGDGFCDAHLEDVWEQELSMCPEEGECTTCVWGS